MTERWNVGVATSAEREELLRRERELFGSESVLRAQWLFNRNPAGHALVVVARAPDGKIAGSRALLPWRVQVDGAQTRVGHYARTWTEPAYRNQGISVAIGQELNRRSLELGYPLVFLFPSDRSIPGHRRVGNRLSDALERRQTLGSIRFFAPWAPGCLDRPVGWVRRRRARAMRGPADWAVDPDPASTACRLWERRGSLSGVWGIRDQAFVRWRVSPESGRIYEAWRMPAVGEARLTAIVHHAGTRARILELWGTADPEETASALAGLTERLVVGGSWLVEWCPPRHGEGPGIADRAGYIARRRAVPQALWFNRNPQELGSLGDPTMYRLTEVDSEYA